MKKGIIAMLILLFCVSYAQAAQGRHTIKEGDMAPDFTVTAIDGTPITLSEWYPEGIVVLIFYRGSWSPSCMSQLNEYKELKEVFDGQGVFIIAVSVDTPKNARRMVEEHGFEFTVVSDPDAALLKLYDLVYKISPERVKKYKREEGIDLKKASGRKDGVVAVPATFVIDTGGTVLYAYANEDYQERAFTEYVLDVVKANT